MALGTISNLELGFNYRITDIQAALGLSQLSKLDGFLQRRRQLAARYDLLLQELPLCLPGRQAGVESAWHLYVGALAAGQDKALSSRGF